MPEFAIVSVTEAQMRTIPGRQGTFMNEYANYIQQLPTGQAGKLRIGGAGETRDYQTSPCCCCKGTWHSPDHQAVRK
jgi:hypothetical protein